MTFILVYSVYPVIVHFVILIYNSLCDVKCNRITRRSP